MFICTTLHLGGTAPSTEGALLIASAHWAWSLHFFSTILTTVKHATLDAIEDHHWDSETYTALVGRAIIENPCDSIRQVIPDVVAELAHPFHVGSQQNSRCEGTLFFMRPVTPKTLPECFWKVLFSTAQLKQLPHEAVQLLVGVVNAEVCMSQVLASVFAPQKVVMRTRTNCQFYILSHTTCLGETLQKRTVHHQELPYDATTGTLTKSRLFNPFHSLFQWTIWLQSFVPHHHGSDKGILFQQTAVDECFGATGMWECCKLCQCKVLAVWLPHLAAKKATSELVSTCFQKVHIRLEFQEGTIQYLFNRLISFIFTNLSWYHPLLNALLHSLEFTRCDRDLYTHVFCSVDDHRLFTTETRQMQAVVVLQEFHDQCSVLFSLAVDHASPSIVDVDDGVQNVRPEEKK